MKLIHLSRRGTDFLHVQSSCGRGIPVRMSLGQGPEGGQSVTAELSRILLS